MHELARLLTPSDPAEAHYWYHLARQRLPPEVVGAQSRMLDWNIEKLRSSLAVSVISDADARAVEF